jgi:hypothetical protein
VINDDKWHQQIAPIDADFVPHAKTARRNEKTVRSEQSAVRRIGLRPETVVLRPEERNILTRLTGLTRFGLSTDFTDCTDNRCTLNIWPQRDTEENESVIDCLSISMPWRNRL